MAAFSKFLKKWQSFMAVFVAFVSVTSFVYAYAVYNVESDTVDINIKESIENQKEVNKKLEECDKNQLKKIDEVDNKINEKINEIQQNTSEIKGNIDIILKILQSKQPSTKPTQ